jgi:transketolase
MMSVAYPGSNVRICGTHGGIGVGPDGPTHHAITDIGLMRMLPGMTVVQPADDNEAVAVTRAALGFRGPLYIRLTRQQLPGLPVHEFRIGSGVVMREGRDVSIIATGSMLHPALEAAERLSKEGVSAEVINIHTIKPIDVKLILKTAGKTGRVVTCEDHGIGGLYSAVSEILSEHLPVPMKGVYVRGFADSGTHEELYSTYGLTAGGVIKAVKEIKR